MVDDEDDVPRTIFANCRNMDLVEATKIELIENPKSLGDSKLQWVTTIDSSPLNDFDSCESLYLDSKFHLPHFFQPFCGIFKPKIIIPSDLTLLQNDTSHSEIWVNLFASPTTVLSLAKMTMTTNPVILPLHLVSMFDPGGAHLSTTPSTKLKRLKLRKNNWDGETYEFNEVLTEFASQKRAYEVVARPVVESVLDGYNGTIKAYGQTATMLRAMEDTFADVSLESDYVSVSYLQLYMETIQDLLDPSNDNIAIVEDPKTNDVSLFGATLVEIRDQQSFIELLSLGEAYHFAANTKLNTESSRSHVILMVHVKRFVKGRYTSHSSENGNHLHLVKSLKSPIVRKAKLVVVDIAGSERIDNIKEVVGGELSNWPNFSTQVIQLCRLREEGELAVTKCMECEQPLPENYAPPADEPWMTEICGCAEDRNSFLTGLFYPCVSFGRNVESLYEDATWNAPCVCHAIFIEGGIALATATAIALVNIIIDLGTSFLIVEGFFLLGGCVAYTPSRFGKP